MSGWVTAKSWLLRPGAAPRPDLGLLVLRLWFGLSLAFGHGAAKLFSMERFTASVTRHGFPLPEVTAPIAMLSELAGGLLIALGLATRPAALFVLSTMLGAAFVAHGGDPFSKKELALAFGAAALVVLVAGPGRYSLDARLAGRR